MRSSKQKQKEKQQQQQLAYNAQSSLPCDRQSRSILHALSGGSFPVLWLCCSEANVIDTDGQRTRCQGEQRTARFVEIDRKEREDGGWWWWW